MPPLIRKEELAETIASDPSDERTMFVAVDGRGGSGKTTLAFWLAERLGGTVVSVDDFARPKVYPEWDWDRFTEQVLEPLSRAEPARYQRYDWVSDRLEEWIEVAPGLLIAEGTSITRTELGFPWDATVWVETPYETRLARGVERDGEAMRKTWVDVWMPAEDRYVDDQDPQDRADFIVLGYDPTSRAS